MRIGVLGSGQVGRAIGSRLVADGHEVRLGSRTTDNEAASAWADEHGHAASHGTFADATAHGELLVNATQGTASLDALATADPSDLAGKVLVDIANPLVAHEDGSRTLALPDTTSLAEEIQRAHPDARVVKALSTMHNRVMVDPGRLPGTHVLFLCGDDPDAKQTVRDLLASWGWTGEMVLDLGDVTAARGIEMLIPLWVRIYQTLGTPDFNFAIARGSASA